MNKLIGFLFLASNLAFGQQDNSKSRASVELIYSLSKSVNDESTNAQYSKAYTNLPKFYSNYSKITQAAKFLTNSDRIHYYQQTCQAIDSKYKNQLNGELAAIEEKINLASALGYRLSQIYDYSLTGSSAVRKSVTIEDIYTAIRTNGKAGVCRHATVAIIELLTACGFPGDQIRQGGYYVNDNSAHIYVEVTTKYGTYSVNWSEIIKEDTDINTPSQMASKILRNHGLVVEWFDKDNKQIGTSYTDEGTIIREVIDSDPQGINQSDINQLGIKAEAEAIGLTLGGSVKGFVGDRGGKRVQGLSTSLLFRAKYNIFFDFLPAETQLRQSFVSADGYDLQDGQLENKRSYTVMDLNFSHKQSLVIAQHLKISGTAGAKLFGAGIKVDYLGDTRPGNYGGATEFPMQVETTFEIPLGAEISKAPIIMFNAGYHVDFAAFNVDSSSSEGKNVYDANGNHINSKFNGYYQIVPARTRFYAAHSLRSADDRSKYELFFWTDEDRLQTKTTSFRLALTQEIGKTKNSDGVVVKLDGQVTKYQSFYGDGSVLYYNASAGVEVPFEPWSIFTVLKMSGSSELLQQNKGPVFSLEVGISLKKK